MAFNAHILAISPANIARLKAFQDTVEGSGAQSRISYTLTSRRSLTRLLSLLFMQSSLLDRGEECAPGTIFLLEFSSPVRFDARKIAFHQ